MREGGLATGQTGNWCSRSRDPPPPPAGSPHPLYQKFFDRFGGAEYEQLTMQARGRGGRQGGGAGTCRHAAPLASRPPPQVLSPVRA